jgi:hypothetical protein
MIIFFGLLLKLEISYNRVIIIYLEGFWFLLLEDFFGRLHLWMVKYLSFGNSFFCLKILF